MASGGANGSCRPAGNGRLAANSVSGMERCITKLEIVIPMSTAEQRRTRVHQMKRSVPCPSCGKNSSEVHRVRLNGSEVLRERSCKDCSHRFWTKERLA